MFTEVTDKYLHHLHEQHNLGGQQVLAACKCLNGVGEGMCLQVLDQRWVSRISTCLGPSALLDLNDVAGMRLGSFCWRLTQVGWCPCKMGLLDVRGWEMRKFGNNEISAKAMVYSVHGLQIQHFLHVGEQCREVLLDNAADIHDLDVPLHVVGFSQMDTTRRVKGLTRDCPHRDRPFA